MNIRPSAVIRNNYNDISNFCKTTGEPVYLTKNGEGDLVVMDIEAFSRREKMLKLRGELIAAEEERLMGKKGYSIDELEVSDDGENWTMVYSNGETSGTTLEIERYDFPPTKGRFIRVKGYGNSLTEWFSLAEAEIYKTNISN